MGVVVAGLSRNGPGVYSTWAALHVAIFAASAELHPCPRPIFFWPLLFLCGLFPSPVCSLLVPDWSCCVLLLLLLQVGSCCCWLPVDLAPKPYWDP